MNNYCNPADIFVRYDRRVILELSGDLNAPQGNVLNIEKICDSEASRVESTITGRYPSFPASQPALSTLPTIPLIITDTVAQMVVGKMYRRRGKMPEGAKTDAEQADQWLADLRARKVNIPGQNAISITPLRRGRERGYGCDISRELPGCGFEDGYR